MNRRSLRPGLKQRAQGSAVCDNGSLRQIWPSQPSVAGVVVCLLLLFEKTSWAQPDATSIPLVCPKVCECALQLKGNADDSSELLAACKDAGLLDIFTQLDPLHTRVLFLDRVKGFVKLGKSRMVDLEATRLQHLMIINSGIKEIQDGAFLRLSELEILDLSQNQIGRLESDSLEGLESLRSLNLSHNQLSDLGMALTGLEKLTSLDLSANSLKKIPDKTFTNMSSLTYLKLDGNPLRSLQAKSFEGLSSLRELTVRDCALSHLDGEMFAYLPRLVILNLGHNRLQKCPPAVALSGLQYLQTIHYDHNEIAELEAGSFSGLRLETMDLSFNRIREITSGTFTGASLAEVDLSHNLLLSLSPDSLTPLSADLEKLSMAGNPLRMLQVTLFSPLEAMTMLNLSACQLESLPHDAVSDLENLKQLDLSHNNIHFLSEGTLGLLEKVEVLELSENPWVCDCSIRALRDWLGKASNSGRLSCKMDEGGREQKGKGDRCVQQMTCAAPSDLLKQQVSKVSEEELAMCEREDRSKVPARTQGAIVASCMGFAIVLLIITIYLWRRGKTAHGLKRVCVPSDAESSHREEDEDDKVPPLPNCRRSSLTNSDHNFVFRHYFDHLVTDPKLMSDDAEDLEESAIADDETAPLGKKERDSQYSSQNSVYSTHSDAAYGMESTV